MPRSLRLCPAVLGYATTLPQARCAVWRLPQKYAGTHARRKYSDMAGPENAKKYQTGIFLAGSASAEFFADIGLCPFEAVKVCAISSAAL